MYCSQFPHCRFHSDYDIIPPLPARHKSPTAPKSKSFSQDLESAVGKSKHSPPTAPPITAPGLSSIETTISQLSDRLHAVEKQLSLVTSDVKALKAMNGMDAVDYSSLQSVQLLTRDGVSWHTSNSASTTSLFISWQAHHLILSS